VRASLIASLIAVLMCSTSAVAQGPATLGSSDANKASYEPVLVQVNEHGQVTDFTPAYSLSPDLMALLRSNLNAMIHSPGTDKSGKPVATQFVINLNMQVTPRSSGGYDAQFTYVSANPVPPGRWYWSHDESGRLGLASRDISNAFQGIYGGPPSSVNNGNFNSTGGITGVGGNRSGGGHH
jgi:hypothetical protein